MGEMVSIIVPVFNAEKTLDRCIESILQQTYLNLELILVNDGSKDASLAICEKYQKDRRVCVYTQENGGPSKARNFGLLKSMGDYIVFVDSDDYIESNLLERCINKIRRDKSDIVIYNAQSVKNIVPNNIEGKKQLREWFPLLYKNYLISYAWNKMIKKEAISSMFDESIKVGEDIRFWLSNINENFKISFIFDNLYHYTVTPESLSRSFDPSIFKTIFEVYEIVYYYYADTLNGKKFELINYLLFREFHTNILKYYKSGQLSFEKLNELATKCKMKDIKNTICYFSLKERIAGWLLCHGKNRTYYYLVCIGD